MKRLICLILLMLVLISGCAGSRQDVSMEEIVTAYEEAGYTVWSEVYDEKLDHGEIASIQANHPDGDYIHFSFFTTSGEAKAHKEEFYHPVTMGLFSVIYGEPSWIRWKVHGNIIAQYSNPEFYEIFLNLLKAK